VGLQFHRVDVSQLFAELRLQAELLNEVNPACIYHFGVMVIEPIDQETDSIRFTELIEIDMLFS